MGFSALVGTVLGPPVALAAVGGCEAGEDLLQALHGVELSIGPMTLTWVRAGFSGLGTEMIRALLGRRVTVSLVSLLA